MIIEQSQATRDWFKVLQKDQNLEKTNYLFYRIQHATSLHYITAPREHLHVMNHSPSCNPFYHVNFPLSSSSSQTKKKRSESRREVRCKEVEKTHHMVESQKSASAVTERWAALTSHRSGESACWSATGLLKVALHLEGAMCTSVQVPGEKRKNCAGSAVGIPGLT